MCTNCTRANLHPGANKFAPPRKKEQISTPVQICTRVQIHKTHRSHGQNYTPGANLHPGCKFAPGCKLRTWTQLNTVAKICENSYNIWAVSWENQCFAYARTKAQISFAVTFVFSTWIEHSLISLNPKFQASSQLQGLYSLVCARPG